MRKGLSIIITLLFCIPSLRSQTLHQKIQGVLLHENNFKYAYLQDTKKGMLVTTVVNNKFEFTIQKNGEFDLRTLSLTIDPIDRKAFISENRVFKAQDSRLISMEDLLIEIGSSVEWAPVKGGPPNIEIDEMFQALRSNDVAEFFQEHSDSQISLLLLKSLISLNKISSDFNYQCSTYFNVLNERLKKTPEGGKVKEMLNN